MTNKTIKFDESLFTLKPKPTKSSSVKQRKSILSQEQRDEKQKKQTLNKENTNRKRLIEMMLKQQNLNKQKDSQKLEKKTGEHLAKKGELDSSLDYLMSVRQAVEQQKQDTKTSDKIQGTSDNVQGTSDKIQGTISSNHNNYTLKNYESSNNDPPVSLIFPDDFSNTNIEEVIVEAINLPQSSIQLPLPKTQIPLYGCLKKGKLPTYKEYKHQLTLKNHGISSSSSSSSSPNDTTNTNSTVLQKKKTVPMQKKILRRTYKIGKSTQTPHIGILLSNKTIRRKVNSDKVAYKQTALTDVKRFLIKHGLIKKGSIAPNNVLRQMYESSMLIGAKVFNKNPENSIYNFLNP
jgi:hypothetical protein